VPFVAAIVPEVDIDAGRVVVTPPPGLFEELPGEDEPEPAADAAETAETAD
jgi:16S rRNA processing protein RimM